MRITGEATGRRVISVVVLLLLFLSSCNSPKRSRGMVVLMEPVPAEQDEEELISGQMLFKACFAAPDESVDEDVLREVVLTYVNSGRDFRSPAGPDGYLLRVIPLNRMMRSTEVAADLTIGLFAATEEVSEVLEMRPLCYWRIGKEELADYWVPTSLLDGYLFRLDWGANEIGPGLYRIVVKFEYEEAERRKIFCREMMIEDQYQVNSVEP